MTAASDDRRGIDVPQTGQFGCIVPDVGNVKQDVSQEFALNSKIELLNIGTPLFWVLVPQGTVPQFGPT